MPSSDDSSYSTAETPLMALARAMSQDTSILQDRLTTQHGGHLGESMRSNRPSAEAANQVRLSCPSLRSPILVYLPAEFLNPREVDPPLLTALEGDWQTQFKESLLTSSSANSAVQVIDQPVMTTNKRSKPIPRTPIESAYTTTPLIAE